MCCDYNYIFRIPIGGGHFSGKDDMVDRTFEEVGLCKNFVDLLKKEFWLAFRSKN